MKKIEIIKDDKESSLYLTAEDLIKKMKIINMYVGISFYNVKMGYGCNEEKYFLVENNDNGDICKVSVNRFVTVEKITINELENGELFLFDDFMEMSKWLTSDSEKK